MGKRQPLYTFSMSGLSVSETLLMFSVLVWMYACVYVHYYIEQFDPKLLTNGILRGIAKIPRKFNLLEVKIKLL